MNEGGREAVDSTASPGGAVERRHGRVLDALDEAVFELDDDGRFVAANAAFGGLVDADREALLGSHVSTVLHDDERLETALEQLQRSAESERTADAGGGNHAGAVSGGGTTVDVAFRTSAGGLVPRELRIEQLGAEDAAVVGVVRDLPASSELPERDGAQDPSGLTSLWETYQSLSSVVDEADVGVFVLDDEFDVAWVDATVEEYFGIDRADVLGCDKRTVVEETIRERTADPESFEEQVLATYDDNSYVEQFECRVTEGPDREARWLEHRSEPIDSGRFAGGRVELYYDVTDRKRSVETERQRAHQFRSLVDAVTEYAIFLLDPQGRVVTWNPGAERIKGYESHEIVGEHFSTFYTDADRLAAVPEQNIARASEYGYTEDEGWRVRADGTEFWANVTITAVRDDDGELQGFAKVTRDMTERREREQALQRERNLIDRILETSPVGIAVVNPDGTLERANERMADLLGVDQAAIPDYTIGDRDLYDEDGRLLPVEERPPGRAFETGEPVLDQEVRLERPDGSDRWLSLNATALGDAEGEHDAEDGTEQVVLSATDVTHLKRLAQQRKRALREREKALSAVQLSTDLLEPDDRPVDDLLCDFATELPEHFRFAEDTGARVAVGEHEAVTEGSDAFDRSIATAARTENGTPIVIEVVRSEDVVPTVDGEFVEEERELIETLAALLKFHFDRREYVQELHAETERLEQFAYAASHDMQEPLRMISSYLQLIERRYGDQLDEDGQEFIDFAVDGAERMHDMIEGLLEYSRVETRGEPLEPVDLDDVVEDVLDDLQLRIEETGADVAVDDLPAVEGDADQLRQVVQNLVENAIKYGDDGSPRIEVSAERRGDRWLVSVSDQGPGIDPDDAGRIFDVFERLHGQEEHSGTGIGLALVERIVERHGGEIWVDSGPGEGATFSFTLPAVEDD